MVAKEESYEKGLETMNEDMLRTECIRLHTELMGAYKNILTQPVHEKDTEEKTMAELGVMIERKRQEFSEICESDMSPVATAELNCHREIQALIRRQRKLLNQ